MSGPAFLVSAVALQRFTAAGPMRCGTSFWRCDQKYCLLNKELAGSHVTAYVAIVFNIWYPPDVLPFCELKLPVVCWLTVNGLWEERIRFCSICLNTDASLSSTAAHCTRTTWTAYILHWTRLLMGESAIGQACEVHKVALLLMHPGHARPCCRNVTRW